MVVVAPVFLRLISLKKSVRYRSMSLSFTLNMNENVEQHIRKKTHKHNVLSFWVESSVISLCGSDFYLIFVCLLSTFELY